MCYLDLGYNKLTGRIPQDLFWHKLKYLYMDYNSLTGQLPANFTLLQSIEYFTLNHNQLSGPISSSLGDCRTLRSLDLAENYLTGSLPNNFQYLSNLRMFKMNLNYLVGVVPWYIGDYWDLKQLFLADNFFHGSLPVELNQLTALDHIELQRNLMTGPLSHFIAGNFTNMKIISLSYNRFHGSLTSLNSFAFMSSLESIFLQDNFLTGTIPSTIFSIRSLTALSFGSNCLSGSIPLAVCASNLSILALDGIRTAAACRSKLLPGLGIGTYSLDKTMQGGVPPCLFDMPSLQVLHLSGNGLMGSIPAHVISPTLRHISLSNNLLTGPIPRTIQRNNMLYLDLAYNKLDGTLDDAMRFDSSGFLRLQNNRLSGRLPQSIMELQNISVLEGNLFDCGMVNSNLPPHDHETRSFHCGSNPLYRAFILLAAFLITFLAVYRAAASCRTQDTAIWRELWSAFASTPAVLAHQRSPVAAAFSHLMTDVRRLSWYLSVFIAAVLQPVYLVCSLYHPMYAEGYAWTASLPFLNGRTVFHALIPTFLVVLLVLVAAFQSIATIRTEAIASRQQHSTAEANGTTAQFLGLVVCVTLVNIFVVVSINFFYFLEYARNAGNDLLLIQIAVSFFKMVWNKYLLVRFMLFFRPYCYGHQLSDLLDRNEIYCLSLLVLLNNIVVPCLATAYLDPQCMYFAFHQSDEVQVSIAYQQCSSWSYLNKDCYSYTTIDGGSSYNPPFFYRYQCTFQMVITYIPIFVITFALITFVNPLLALLLKSLHNHFSPQSVCSRFVRLLLPPLMKPLPSDDLETTQENFYLHKHVIISDLVSYFAITVIFGAVYPPLAIVGSCGIFSYTYFYEKHMNQLLLLSTADQLPIYEKTISEEMIDFDSILFTLFALLPLIACAAYGGMLIDVLDQDRRPGDVWTCIAASLLPLLLWGYIHWDRSLARSVEGYTRCLVERRHQAMRLSEIEFAAKE